MPIQRKTVLITGCSEGGLGAALAIELHKAGYRVFATARNVDKMAGLPEGIERFTLEVTSRDSINKCCEEVAMKAGGTLNMLINNAGVWQTMPFADQNISRARNTFDVNFWGQFETTQAFLPLLLAAQQQGQKATVVLVSSLAGTGPTPFSSIYGASKAAADYVFNTLREELKPWDINVVLLRTGAVRSNMVNNRVEGGERHARLPDNSLYRVAKEPVELFMSGKAAEAGIPAEDWAQMVVKNLEKSAPPRVVFGGGYAFMAWIMQYLPIPASAMQGMVNRITGLEAVEKAVKDRTQQSE